MKYLLSLPGVGGYYGATVGAAKNIIDRINKQDPDAIIHYSGVSSGAFCALVILLTYHNNSRNYTKYILQKHKKLIEYINEKGKWSDSIFDYYHNNNLYFAGIEKFIRKNVHDIQIINNKLHIGYCRILDNNKLEFTVVNEFANVDDLINALLASSHYTLFLKTEKYYEFRNHKCVDGVFMNNNVCLPGYINVKINPILIDNLSVWDKLLDPCHERFLIHYKYGKKVQKKQKKLNQFIMTDEETLLQTNQKYQDIGLWDIITVIHSLFCE